MTNHPASSYLLARADPAGIREGSVSYWHRRPAVVLTFVVGALLSLFAAWQSWVNGNSLQVAGRFGSFTMTYLVAGFVASLHRPFNRTGRLLSAIGLAAAIPPILMRTRVELLAFAGHVGWGSEKLFLMWLLLAYPSGHIKGTVERRTLAILTAVFLALSILIALTVDPGCKGCPGSPFSSSAIQAAMLRSVLVAFAVVAHAAALLLILRRWLASNRVQRRILAPVLVGGLLAALGSGFGTAGQLSTGITNAGYDTWRTLSSISMMLVPVGLVVGILRMRLNRASVGDIAIELADDVSHRRLQDVLVRRLGDPTLVVGLWSPSTHAYLDTHGSGVDITPGTDHSVTLLENRGKPVAALVHDPSLEEDASLVQSVLAITRLVADKEHLKEEVRSRTRQLREARNRVVASAQRPIEAATGTPKKLIRGRYEALERVGAGGQGEVLRAVDYQHDRQVALKIRRVWSQDQRERLLQEARILLNLRPHPGLPLVREDFFENGLYYIVMDWVEGPNLNRVLQERGDPGLPFDEVFGYLEQVSDALAHLHSHEPPIIHQDVKPSNLILTSDQRVILVDFGLSSSGGEPRVHYGGTSGFLAPELTAGEPPRPESDVYGLAATTFTLLTCSPPRGLLPPWPNLPEEIAHRVEEAIRRGLSIDPDRRFCEAPDFLQALAGARAIKGDGPRRRFRF